MNSYRRTAYRSYHSAYRPCYRFESALIETYSEVLEYVITEFHVIMTFIDCRKAFHIVADNILIRKLKTEYDFSGATFSLFSSYLSNMS